MTKGDKWAQTGHYSDSRGTVAGARGSEDGRVVGGSGLNGSGFVGQSGSGDIYAGKDGNAYKKTDSGWHQYEKGGGTRWIPLAPRPTGKRRNKAPARTGRERRQPCGQRWVEDTGDT